MFSKVIFINFGKFRSRDYDAIFKEYVQRLERYTKVEIKEIKIDRDEPAFFDKAKDKILAAIDASYVLVFTEYGKSFSSMEFSDFIKAGTGVLSVVVGSSWGVPEFVTKKANMQLSFGKMTMPHEAVRAIVAEQLYRANTIIRGESYHK